MYFAAGGNRHLTRFHQKRVTAEGVAVRKKEPLELKMPVDDGKEMTVTVRGGYNVLTLKSLAEAPRSERSSCRGARTDQGHRGEQARTDSASMAFLAVPQQQ